MSTSVPIHTDFNLQKELCYFQNRLQSTMTDLRPLMGLRFECVSVSGSPGLDSEGLNQRKLRGFGEPQKGCSPHCPAIYLYSSWQSFMSLINPCIRCFEQKLEIQSTPGSEFLPFPFSLCAFLLPPHTFLKPSMFHEGMFSKLLSHDKALF